MLTKDQIFTASDLSKVEVAIPEWGGAVYVRTMTGGERDRFEECHHRNPWVDLRARLAVATVCDESGHLLFGPDDIPALTGKSAAALDRIFTVSARLSGITKEDVAALEKNSAASPSASSASGSPGT